MAKKWKEILGTFAPAIGNAIGGPAGGLAVDVALKALGIEGGDERDLKKAVENLTSEDYTKLHEADMSFRTRLAELEVEETKVLVADRQGAREMRLKSGRWTADILAFITVAGFFAVLGSFFWFGSGLDPLIKDPLLILIGVLGAAFKDIYQFFFGSSKGSKEKTTVIEGLKK